MDYHLTAHHAHTTLFHCVHVPVRGAYNDCYNPTSGEDDILNQSIIINISVHG